MSLIVAGGASPEPSCPGADGSIYTSSNGAQYQISCGIGYQYDDLPMSDTPTFGDCMTACNKYQATMSANKGGACVGGVWSLLVQVCYLKYRLENAKSELSISGRLVQYQVDGPAVYDLSMLGPAPGPVSSPPSNPPVSPPSSTAPVNNPSAVIAAPAATSLSVMVAAPVVIQSTSTPTIVMAASTPPSIPSSSPQASPSASTTSEPRIVTSSTVASPSDASLDAALNTTQIDPSATSTSSIYTTSLSASPADSTPGAIANPSLPTPSGLPGGHTEGVSTIAKIGIAIASAIVLIAAAALLFHLFRRRQQRKKLEDEVMNKPKMDAWYRQGGRTGRNGLHELMGSDTGMAELSTNPREFRQMSKFDFS